MGRKLRLGRTADLMIPDGCVLAVTSDGISVGLLRAEGQLHACSLNCTHDDCDLSQYGAVEGTDLVCECHFARFDVRSGTVLAGPAFDDLKVYPVADEDGELVIEVDD